MVALQGSRKRYFNVPFCPHPCCPSKATALQAHGHTLALQGPVPQAGRVPPGRHPPIPDCGGGSLAPTSRYRETFDLNDRTTKSTQHTPFCSSFPLSASPPVVLLSQERLMREIVCIYALAPGVSSLVRDPFLSRLLKFRPLSRFFIADWCWWFLTAEPQLFQPALKRTAQERRRDNQALSSLSRLTTSHAIIVPISPLPHPSKSLSSPRLYKSHHRDTPLYTSFVTTP